MSDTEYLRAWVFEKFERPTSLYGNNSKIKAAYYRLIKGEPKAFDPIQIKKWKAALNEASIDTSDMIFPSEKGEISKQEKKGGIDMTKIAAQYEAEIAYLRSQNKQLLEIIANFSKDSAD